MPAKERVILTGDISLVQEYAAACHGKGMTVSVILKRGSGAPKLPRGVRKIARAAKTATIGLELTNLDHDTKRRNLVELDRVLPRGSTILSSAVTVTLSEQSTWIRNPGRLVGLGALPSFLDGDLIEICRTDHTSARSTEKSIGFIKSLGKEHSLVGDSVGLVLPRIICSLTNEACFALMEKVALQKDIDTAMKLGTNYPRGPVEWGEIIGPDQVLAVMEALHSVLGEDRYRPSPRLRQSAQKGSFF